MKAAPDYVGNPAHPFNRKVREAVTDGILVTFAGGNGGTDPCMACNIQAPTIPIVGANGHPQVMTVAAVDVNDDYALFSSYGPALLAPMKPDFAAPATYFGYYDKLAAGYPDTGTSAACAVTAGVVALMMDAYDQAAGAWPTPQAVKSALRKTAFQIDPLATLAVGGFTYGRYAGSGVIRPFDAVSEVLP
jgi:subtilisin family serine protease